MRGVLERQNKKTEKKKTGYFVAFNSQLLIAGQLE